MLCNLFFNGKDIKESESWKIQAFWKCLQADFISLKHKKIDEVKPDNIQEVMDLVISYYVLSHDMNDVNDLLNQENED